MYVIPYLYYFLQGNFLSLRSVYFVMVVTAYQEID